MRTRPVEASPAYDVPVLDRVFVEEMLAVQQQAVRFSVLARTHGASAEVRDLASRIGRAQGEQVASMRSCLEDWGTTEPPGTGPRPARAAARARPRDASRLHDLDRRRGAAFDGRFLLVAQQHHREALRRTRLELRDGRDPSARALAGRMQAQMRRELQTMVGMTRDRPGSG